MTTHGEILIANLTVPPTVGVGDVLINSILHPSLLVGTELQLYAKMYEKCKYERLAIHYKPTTNVTQTGQLVGFIDPDCQDSYSTGTQGVRSAQSVEGSRTHAVYDAATYLYKSKNRYNSYWCDQGKDSSETNEAKLVVQANWDYSGAAFQAGSFYMTYKIRFFNRHNQWSSISSSAWARVATYPSGSQITAITTAAQSTFDITLVGNTITVKGFRTGDYFSVQCLITVSAGTISVNPSTSFSGTSTSSLFSGAMGTTQWMVGGYAQVISSNGNFTVTLGAITYTGSLVPSSSYILFQPLPANLTTLTNPMPIAPSSSYIEDLIERKFKEMNFAGFAQKEEDRHRRLLTDSEIESEFTAIKQLRALSPSRTSSTGLAARP